MGTILLSLCRDPRVNLALEEHLIEAGKPLLYLWQNEPSVILGRNQDPYAECPPAVLKADGVHLVRRKSGGGAVYHDLGNLNITLLSEKAPDAVEKNFSFLCAALENLGIHAQVSGRNDLEVQGKKVSGSAFYETGSCFCHHCTMLVTVDPQALSRYLTPSPLKLQSKGIASVRSRVTGLQDLQPDLTVEALVQALCQAYGGPSRTLSREEILSMPDVAEKARKYGSWARTYGESPKSDLTFEDRFSWGLIKVEFTLFSGAIQSCRISTDSLLALPFLTLSQALRGCPLYGEAYRAAISSFPDPEIRADLQKLLF